MIKTFFYQFTDPLFIKTIQVNTNECKTIEDLKKKIATFFQISVYRLIIENQPNESLLEKITEKFVFIIKFPLRRTNITIFFQTFGSLQIENGYKMSYEQIIDYFHNKQLYYSNECAKNHIQFFLFDKELPHIQFPFLAIPNQICVNIKNNCQTVVLKYGNKNFIFCENEYVSEAYKLIKDTFKGCNSVLIQVENSKVNDRNKLKKFTNYEIKIDFKITFKNAENWNEEVLYLDLLSTVLDAKKQLLNKLMQDKNININLNPEKINIYNANMQIINDSNIFLKKIQNFSNVFYFKYQERSPEKVVQKKPYFELDPKFKYTPKKAKRNEMQSFYEYPKTPEQTTKFDLNQKTQKNSKTPEKESKSFFTQKSKFSQKDPKINFNEQSSVKSQTSSKQLKSNSDRYTPTKTKPLHKESKRVSNDNPSKIENKKQKKEKSKAQSNSQKQNSRIEDNDFDEYDDYFEINSPKKASHKDESEDDSQSFKLNELKKLMNEEEEDEEINENSNMNIDKNNEVKNEKEEEDDEIEFNFSNNKSDGSKNSEENGNKQEEESKRKMNKINDSDKEEEEVMDFDKENSQSDNYSNNEQSKANDAPNSSIFSETDDNESNNNQIEKEILDIFEEEEEEKSN